MEARESVVFDVADKKQMNGKEFHLSERIDATQNLRTITVQPIIQ